MNQLIIFYSDLLPGFFDVVWSSADGNSVALPLSGDAVLVRKMNFGAGVLHNFINSSSGSSNEMRMVRIKHFHTQSSRRSLNALETKSFQLIPIDDLIQSFFFVYLVESVVVRHRRRCAAVSKSWRVDCRMNEGEDNPAV